MERKLKWLFILEAIVCLFLGVSGSQWITGVMTFPFAPIAAGLRQLSLSGGAGNVAAIILYVLLCISPLLFLFMSGRKREMKKEDALLIVLSALLFGGMYLMINPGLMSGMAAVFAGTDVWKGTICTLFYSVLLAWWILRLVRSMMDAPAEKLLRYFRLMLYILAGVFVFQIFAVGLGSLIMSVQALVETNSIAGAFVVDTIIFHILSFVVSVLPYVLDLLVISSTLKLLYWLEMDYYSDETLKAADALCKSCTRALVISVLVNLCFNLLQLLLSSRLLSVNTSVQLPLASIVLVLLALLFARYIRQSRDLKEENDSFI